MNMYIKQLQKKLKKFRYLRYGAWAVVAVTGGVSVWGNYVHATTANMDDVGRAISILPPVLYMLAFELGSRIPMRKDAAWYKRLIRPLATLVVAGIGGYLSYFHQRDAFAAHTGNDLATARLLPLSIDGLLIVAAVCVYELTIQLSTLSDQMDLEQMKAEAKAAGTTISQLREPVSPGRETKRERIALLVSKSPDLKPEQVASITGASVGYVNNLMTELRKGNGAELVTAG